MSHTPTRKQFFAKLLGTAAALAVVPKFFAKAASEPNLAPGSAPVTGDSAAVKIQPEPRAVARRADSI